MSKNFFFCTYKKTNWVEIVLPLGPKFLWLWRSPELYWRQIAAIVPKFPSPRAHLKCAWTHFLSCSPNFDHIVSKPNQPKKETKISIFLKFTLFENSHTWSWTLAKSTLFKSLNIWLTCDEFCKTALAAWAKWFNPVYLRKVCAKDLTAVIWIKEEYH